MKAKRVLALLLALALCASLFAACGGDGGCNICGGLGPFLGFLPCSPHYRPEVQEDNELDGDYDFYRPIIRVEMS